MVLSTHLLVLFYQFRNIFAFHAIKLRCFVPLCVLTLSFSLTGPGVLSASDLLLFKTPNLILCPFPQKLLHNTNLSPGIPFPTEFPCVVKTLLLYFNSLFVHKKVFHEDLIF